MTRERDTFDVFQDQERHDRGRFSDNEARQERKAMLRAPAMEQFEHRAPRVTGASDLVDLDLIMHLDHREKEKAIKVSFGDMRKAVWLPRSLIKVEITGELKRIYVGRLDQKVRVTMPEWLAREKGLI